METEAPAARTDANIGSNSTQTNRPPPIEENLGSVAHQLKGVETKLNATESFVAEIKAENTRREWGVLIVLSVLILFIFGARWTYEASPVWHIPAFLGLFLLLDLLTSLGRTSSDQRRPYRPNLRLLAFGILSGLAVFALGKLNEAFTESVPALGDNKWAEWRWVLRLLLAVLFAGLVALGIAQTAKDD